jgi:hypothetical protein
LANVAVSGASAPTIRGCRIHDGKQAGVLVLDGGAGLLENCEIVRNAAGNLVLNGAGPISIANCHAPDAQPESAVDSGE